MVLKPFNLLAEHCRHGFETFLAKLFAFVRVLLDGVHAGHNGRSEAERAVAACFDQARDYEPERGNSGPHSCAYIGGGA